MIGKKTEPIKTDYRIKTAAGELFLETASGNFTDSVVDELIELRRRKNMTQQDIATLTGMQRANVARLESKGYTPSIESLLRYAEVLGMKLKLTLETPNITGTRIGIGIQSFAELRENNFFYVDKTEFIKDWWESGDSVTLITRPRRFGKTLNMSMLEHFFSIRYAGRGDLFEGLTIWKQETYRKLQGTYPVLSLSFANVKDTTYPAVSYRIRQLISNLYEEHDYLKESPALSEAEKAYFTRVTEQLTEEDAPMAVNRLTKFLGSHFGKKVILLLDEYDTPMQEAYVNGYWEQLAAFTRVFFNATFKTNTYMARGIMTGITRVSKESFFSDLNHLKVVTTTSEEYADAFGFTEPEVIEALALFGLSQEMEQIKWWYDGFSFGSRTDMYNPWSILNFLDTKKYEAYWINTSSNALASRLIQEGNSQIKDLFERLLKDEAIQYPLDEQLVFSQLKDNTAAALSLLLASGYLKVTGRETLQETALGEHPSYTLSLTNMEVKAAFFTMVKEWFRPAEQDYKGFTKALLQQDIKAMNSYMNRVTLQIFSCFDTGKGPLGAEPERFYHGFVLGLLTELNDRYIITSNRESGFGRYDVMLEPKKRTDPAMILEFKVQDTEEEETLQETVKAALQQIKEKRYAETLLSHGIPETQIHSYGFAFHGKHVLIGC